MNWKEYQNRTAEVFRRAGCNAEVEAIIEGVRGKHEIDVFVTFEQYGITCTWVIECKCWNSNVPKEKVLALQAILDDVGADRGVLISKTGFQSGAIKAARKNNITLTSLEDLIDDLKESSTKRIIETLEVSLTKTKHRIFSLAKTEMLGENSFRRSFPKGIDGKSAVHYGGELCILEQGFENLKLGNQSYPYRFDEDGNKIHSTISIEEFLDAVQRKVEVCNLWLNSLGEQS